MSQSFRERLSEQLRVVGLLPYEARRRRRARFDPAEHSRWLHNFWKRQTGQAQTDELLKRERAY